MGAGPSGSAEGKELLKSDEVRDLVDDLQLTISEVKYFLNLFYTIDLDKGGTIDLKEFCKC
jgi:hypothetical protein